MDNIQQLLSLRELQTVCYRNWNMIDFLIRRCGYSELKYAYYESKKNLFVYHIEITTQRTFFQGPAMAQAFSRRSLIAEARFRSRVCLLLKCGIAQSIPCIATIL
jgi:hypothetical protein